MRTVDCVPVTIAEQGMTYEQSDSTRHFLKLLSKAVSNLQQERRRMARGIEAKQLPRALSAAFPRTLQRPSFSSKFSDNRQRPTWYHLNTDCASNSMYFCSSLLPFAELGTRLHRIANEDAVTV